MIELLTEPLEIEKFCAALLDEKKHHSPLYIGIDTEFIRESTYIPQIELIQVASRLHSCIIDAASFKNRPEGLIPFLNILKDPDVIKIVHAASGDQECIYMNFQTMMQPLFDTAIAASLCGFGDNMGLAPLVEELLHIKLVKGHARTNWALRPLSQAVLAYALADVQHLIPLTQQLIEKLTVLKRVAWAFELSAKWHDPDIFTYPLSAIALKLLKRRSSDPQDIHLMMRLLQWREKTAKALNSPRKWIMTDQTLQSICLIKPDNETWLLNLRGFRRNVTPHVVEEILSIIREAPTAMMLPLDAVPMDLEEPESESEKSMIQLCHMYLQCIGSQKSISSRKLIQKKQLLKILRDQKNTVEDWKDQNILSHEALDLIGKELMLFLKGEVGLTIKNKKIQVVPLS